MSFGLLLVWFMIAFRSVGLFRAYAGMSLDEIMRTQREKQELVESAKAAVHVHECRIQGPETCGAGTVFGCTRLEEAHPRHPALEHWSPLIKIGASRGGTRHRRFQRFFLDAPLFTQGLQADQ